MSNIQHIPGGDAVTDLLTMRNPRLALQGPALAPSTLRVYATAWKRFTAFCSANGYETLPAHPEAVCEWIEDLYHNKVPRRTFEQYLAAVRHYHLRNGYISPTLAAVVKEMVQKYRRQVPKTRDTRRALTVSELAAMIATCSTVTEKGARDAALLAVGFFGAMRGSELLGLTVETMREEPEGVSLEILRSKTDQAGEGRRIALFRLPGAPHCPVTLLRRWLAIRPDCPGILFPSLDALAVYRKACKALPGSGGRLPSPMSLYTLQRIILATAQEAGVSTDRLSTHSLRIGYITEAKRRRATVEQIARQTGHKDFRMIESYTRFISIFEGNAGRVFRDA